jgi:hypothetical protein
MRRIHFIEIHDQPWVPASLRDAVTDALQFGFNLLRIYAPVVPLLERALDATQNQIDSLPPEHGRSIVDLCSGGAGPWLDLSRRLNRQSLKSDGTGREAPKVDVRIRLTDKYPNVRAFQKTKEASENYITFDSRSIDAMNVPADLKGLRTLFTSFHHFPPDEARAILQNAVNAGEGIGIFEVPRRAPLTVALTFALVLLLFLGTPWIRPFRWSRLLWTFLIPIIPAVLLFDGVVSCLRAYSPQELEEVIGKLNVSEQRNQYRWEIGECGGGISRSPVTYLIGYPVNDPEPASGACIKAGSLP